MKKEIHTNDRIKRNNVGNFWEIINLKASESQPVGFTKIVYVPKCVGPYHFLEDSYMIDAIMIDDQHQGMGYGKEALCQVLR